MKKIGPILSVTEDEKLTMQMAYETDFEMGCHHLANAVAEEFKQKFPTVMAMADEIEQERDYLREKLIHSLLVHEDRTEEMAEKIVTQMLVYRDK